MTFPDLRSFLRKIEEDGGLIRIGEELDPKYEVACAIRETAKRQGAAVLCERVRGYNVQVVGNVLGSLKRLAMALDVKEEDLHSAYLAARRSPLKPTMVKSAPVQEVVIDRDIDISRVMPVLTHFQRDASPYVTCAFTVAKDPETGIRGIGIHRIQIKGPDKIGISLGSPPLSHFLAKAEQQNRPLEIAIVSGADPLTYFASPQHAPQGLDKYEIAGGLAKTPIQLVKCHSVDLEVPASAEFVLEGRIIPHSREKEGPLGESTGYYVTFDNPVARIQAITHRKNPIYHALVPFGPEEDVLFFPYYQVDALLWLQGIVPCVKKLHSPKFGVTYVQIEKKSDAEVRQIIDVLFARGGMLQSKVVVVVDVDVDILDTNEVAWALGSRVRPDRDVIIGSNLPGLPIDPSTKADGKVGEFSELQTTTSKIGIDATKPLHELAEFEKIDMPPEVRRKIATLLK